MGVVAAGYSIYLRPDLLQVFWAGMQAGDFITDAVAAINTSRRTGRRVLVEAGGVRPRRGRDLKGRCLTFAQREEIAVLRAQGQSLRQIATAIGRSASTVSRELRRNTRAGSAYRATSAHALAYERASRPKPAKLHTNTVLRAKVEGDRSYRHPRS
jgi:hypothetical protein